MTPNTRAIRVALVGYGLGGEIFHAPLIASTCGFELAAVVTKDVGRRAKAHQAFPAAQALDDVDDLVANASNFDLVVVASPNATHESIALRALEAGINVVVDKPFAATANGARRLIDAAAHNGRLVVPFQNRRWDGDFLTVRRLIANGELGDVFRFESRMERWRAAAKPRWATAHAARDAEGIIYDLGSHLVDQALVLFGPAVAVYAEADGRSRGVTVDDDSFIAITHGSGARSRLTVSTMAALPGARMSVYGNRGTYVKSGVDRQEADLKAGKRPGDAGWGDEDASSWGLLHDGTMATAVRTEKGAYDAFYHGIVQSLLAGAVPPVDAGDAVNALAVIEAALESAATRRVVKIAPSTFGRSG